MRIREYASPKAAQRVKGPVLNRILVAYDDSTTVRRALAEVVCLAQVEGARLIALAVEEHLPHFDGASLGEVREEHERRQRTCRLWLRSAEAYADEHGVRLRTDIRSGSFMQQLARSAAAHQADLVVLGRRNRPGTWGRFTGSKAERATRHVGCSIFIAG
ncbi:MAG TPA: universal stress protein [Actinobacteria bacterium]|nr:universal stress protein [Actinomycetota bacterium]